MAERDKEKEKEKRIMEMPEGKDWSRLKANDGNKEPVWIPIGGERWPVKFRDDIPYDIFLDLIDDCYQEKPIMVDGEKVRKRVFITKRFFMRACAAYVIEPKELRNMDFLSMLGTKAGIQIMNYLPDPRDAGVLEEEMEK